MKDTVNIKRRKLLCRANVSYLLTIVTLLLLLLFTKVLKVNGISMEPTYHDGDILLSVVTTEFEKGDVVGIYVKDLNEYVIKRVVATAGDYVVSSPTEVIVNGEVLFQMPFTTIKSKTGIVPEDKLFLVGDNYVDSYDSRHFGSVPIEGKVYHVIQGIHIPQNVAFVLQVLLTCILVCLLTYMLKCKNLLKERNNEKREDKIN